jgi:hypothetical protein
MFRSSAAPVSWTWEVTSMTTEKVANELTQLRNAVSLVRQDIRALFTAHALAGLCASTPPSADLNDVAKKAIRLGIETAAQYTAAIKNK